MIKIKFKILGLLLGLLFTTQLEGQSESLVYGIVRQNFYSTFTDQIDSTITYQQLDSSTIRLGYTDPVLGFVNNAGNVTYSQAVNLTGAALDPYNNTYIFLGGYGINTFDIATGNLINQVPMSNPLGFSYFDNFRFNNSDSSLYGLSRRVMDLDTITENTQTGVFLAKANSQTGLITEISPNPIAQGFTLAGSAIDPYDMVYYFALGNNLIGLDLYTGEVYTNVPMIITDGFAFGNFTYSCADNGLYGLVRQNYYSYETDPLMPDDSIQVLDSATVKLGRVDPVTGIVTNISPYAIAQGGYTVNGGAAIDPDNMIYYYSTGNAIVGVSLITGLVTSESNYSFADGEYFDLMRNFENCISASALRPNPNVTSIKDVSDIANMELYPNPFSNRINLKNTTGTETYTLLNSLGLVIWSGNFIERGDFSHLTSGLYLLKGGNKVIKLIKE